jgi:hypothetical protein
MMSTPASSQRRIWSIVAFGSLVGVLVIVCTVTGASPPTGTLPDHDLAALSTHDVAMSRGGTWRRADRQALEPDRRFAGDRRRHLG